MNDLTTPERAVTALNRIRAALSEAADISEVLAFHDQADTIHHYIKHAALSLEMQNQAAEVKLLVERKIGSLLADMTLRGGDHKSKLRSAKNGLENLGIIACVGRRGDSKRHAATIRCYLLWLNRVESSDADKLVKLLISLLLAESSPLPAQTSRNKIVRQFIE